MRSTDLLREGRWESWLHARLRERGFELFCEPDAVVEHEKDFGVGEFIAQRFHYARSYAGMRNPELGSATRRLLLRLAAAYPAALLACRAQRFRASAGIGRSSCSGRRCSCSTSP